MRTGVSLYSYQQAYYLRELTLEGCIEAAVAAGGTGIETIAEQMMPGFPELDDAFYDRWHGWMQTRGATPTAHDMFLDVRLFHGRALTEEEQVAMLHRDIRHAARLGCAFVRMVVLTPPAVVAKAIPFAAEHGVTLVLEVHTPWHLEHPWIAEHLETYDRFGPEHVGLVPDLGIFVERFPRNQAARAVRDGVRADVVEHVVAAYDAAAGGTSVPDLSWLLADVERRGGGEPELAFAREAGRHVWSPPESLAGVRPWVHHVHGKFWEVTDAGEEYSIPYRRVLRVLAEIGYDGWISSEYEGQSSLRDIDEVDEIDQVRRHQSMLAALLEEAACTSS